MQENPLRRLQELGQSVWVDDLNREILSSGRLARLVNEDGVTGVTSNPKTFSDGVLAGNAYDTDIRALAEQGMDPEEVYEALAVRDIKEAADHLLPTYSSTLGRDGFVSLEVSPRLAHDAAATVDQGRRLWAAVDRPNLMIKVPATAEGIQAIGELIAEGIHVNVTLLFGLQRYQDAAEAYVEGLTRRARAGKPVDDVMSVASFFLSRIDVLVDKLAGELTGNQAELANSLRGQVAIASAKLAHQIHGEVFTARSFQKLAALQAKPQRLLWASTGAKRAEDDPLKYVEPLIGPYTITTLPLPTLEAYRKSGNPALRLEEGRQPAEQVFQKLADARIDAVDLAEQLEREGVRKFNEPYDKLIDNLTRQISLLHV